ncbi:hypothetical protein FB451DRAFT_1492240 [Mycena latifolia]|nr:hypothetical protein FB451DRAFT_1492240 [Mycena latifolia]
MAGIKVVSGTRYTGSFFYRFPTPPATQISSLRSFQSSAGATVASTTVAFTSAAGWRQTLKAMNPAFFRFPGGNNLEGGITATRWQWRNTVGPLVNRPGRVGDWSYINTDGPGLYEYLQWIEVMGMKPIMVVWAGYSLDGDALPQASLAPYIQDAIDQINFAIGPTTNAMGALRAVMGHPAPFTVRFIEVGQLRCHLFPQLTYIATSATSGFVPAITPAPKAWDLHIYSNPNFFRKGCFNFDILPRNSLRVFQGEYAVTRSDSGAGLPYPAIEWYEARTLRSLLRGTARSTGTVAEAAYMTGFDRNSDIVFAASYAPLLNHVNSTQWTPNLTSFTPNTLIRSTSCYVQQMFGTYKGDTYLKSTPNTASSAVQWSVTKNTAQSLIYLKVISTATTSNPVVFTLPLTILSTAGTGTVLSAATGTMNTPTNPSAAVPRVITFTAGTMITYVAPALSASVLIANAPCTWLMPCPNTLTKQERAILLLTLNDPMHEDSTCLLGIYTLLDKALTEEDDPRQGPFLRAAMIFLSAKRSDEEHGALRERLFTCACNQKVRSQHKPVFRPLPEVLEALLFHICSTISDYFMRIGPGKFRKQKANALPEAQPWPCCVSDVIPAAGGEQEVLEGLVGWAVHGPGEGHSIFALIGAMARFWEPFAVQLFEVPVVFGLATYHLQCALDAYEPRALTPAALMVRFISPVIACAQGFFHMLSEVDMGRTIALIVPIYEQLYAIAVPIEPILLHVRAHTASSMDDCRRFFHLVRTLRPCIADGAFVTHPAGERPAMAPFTHFGAAFHRMVEIRNRNQCLHVGCTAKIQARAPVCARCGIVRYCSRECLEAAWAAPRLAHRSLCKQIVALRTATLLTDDKAWAHTVRDSSVHRAPKEFAALCTAQGASARAAEAVWRGIILLTEEKGKFAAEAAERDAAEEDVGLSERSPTTEAPRSNGCVAAALPAEEVD